VELDPAAFSGDLDPVEGTKRTKLVGCPRRPPGCHISPAKAGTIAQRKASVFIFNGPLAASSFRAVWSVSPSFSMVKNAAFFTRISCLPFGIAPIQFCLPHDGWTRVLSVQLPGVATG